MVKTEVTQLPIGVPAPTGTRLVVEPEHRQGLVPLALAEVTADGVRFGCTLAEFARLELSGETHLVPGSRARAARGPGQVLARPSDSTLGTGGKAATTRAGPQVLASDVGPPGEVGVRRGDPVRAVDGDIGRVQGLVIDRASHQVTHVLLREARLRGRTDVAIPVSAVAGGGAGGVRLRITRQEERDLPAAAGGHDDG